MQTNTTFRKPVSNRSMGIEIECLVPRPLKDSLIHRNQGFFYATNDASITAGWGAPVSGIEFVSQPLTPEWLKKEIMRLKKRVGRWDHNETCGIHIHVSRQWLSEKGASGIADMLHSFNDEQMKLLFGRKPNDYCRNIGNSRSRYATINITNPKTIEFRGFASGDAQWACYCVDVVCKLIAYKSKSYNFDSLLDYLTKE